MEQHEKLLVVPPSWCPIPSGINPQWREIDAGSVAFLHRFGIPTDPVQRDRLARSSLGEVASRVVPEGAAQGVRLLSDFFIWILAFDDLSDEGALGRAPGELAAVVSRLQRDIEAPVPSSHANLGPYAPYGRALREVRERLAGIASPLLLTRWVETVRASFLALVTDAHYRTLRTPPNLNDHVIARLESIWTRNTLLIVAAIDGPQVPAELLEQPAVRALTEMTCLLIAWDNDLYSYPKDQMRSQGDPNNIIEVVAHARGVTFTEAQQQVIIMRDRIMTRFLDLRSQVSARTDTPSLRRYLGNLAATIRGQLDWARSSHRYHTPIGDAIWPNAFTDTPADTTLEPIPIPAIAWWWSPQLLPA